LNINEQKQMLRALAKESRSDLSMEERQTLSEQILAQFLKTFSCKGLKISIYLSISTQFEIDTLPWITALEKDNEFYVPITDFETLTMAHCKYNTGDAITCNRYGIPEPSDCTKTIDPIELDLVIIPLLVADLQGNRLGYGKGFYDRFLTQCREDVLKVGLNYFEPIAQIPTEDTDIPLNYLVSPTRCYQF